MPIIREMLNPDVNSRLEINDLLDRPEVVSRVRQRKWAFRKAWVLQKFYFVVRIWTAIIALMTSFLYKKGRHNKDEVPTESGRKTPEPLPAARDIPNVLLNYSSFSDGKIV